MKKFFVISSIIIIWIILFVIWINFYVLSFSKNNYHEKLEDLQKNYVGLVLGASVIGKSKPSDILKDRLKVAYDAYNLGKIEKIIVSGDNSISSYNEPLVMQKYLIELGVEVDDIYLDYAGFDTYDSIYRAREIFGVNSLVIFTQDFHLKRAMYISKRLGLITYGVQTNLHNYVLTNYNNNREIFARIKAFLEVEIFKPKPKFLGEQIEIISDQKIKKAKNDILGK